MHGTHEQDWADGHYRFRLGIGQWREIEEKCNAGPAEIYGRLLRGNWRMNDLRETIRLGLIGGGTTPADALSLTKRYVDERPLLESVPLALIIVGVALTGPIEDSPKVGEAAVVTEPATGEPPSPPFTETVQ